MGGEEAGGNWVRSRRGTPISAGQAEGGGETPKISEKKNTQGRERTGALRKQRARRKNLFPKFVRARTDARKQSKKMGDREIAVSRVNH